MCRRSTPLRCATFRSPKAHLDCLGGVLVPVWLMVVALSPPLLFCGCSSSSSSSTWFAGSKTKIKNCLLNSDPGAFLESAEMTTRHIYRSSRRAFLKVCGWFL